MRFEEMQRILVPVDFSRTANRAFDYARALAQRLGADLHVVYVLDTHYLSGALNITIEPLNEMIEEWKARSREKLERIYRQGESGKPNLKIHIREGKTHEEILNAAHEIGADMIVIGSHGRSGLEKYIFGSVAEKVLKISDIPVLLIKLKGELREGHL